MLALHCSRLIVMQIFQLHCVTIKPRTVSCDEIKLILTRLSPTASEMTQPATFLNTDLID